MCTEALHGWTSPRIRRYLMAMNGISGKSVACLLLYCMRRLDFAVDANVAQPSDGSLVMVAWSG